MGIKFYTNKNGKFLKFLLSFKLSELGSDNLFEN